MMGQNVEKNTANLRRNTTDKAVTKAIKGGEIMDLRTYKSTLKMFQKPTNLYKGLNYRITEPMKQKSQDSL
jgi:hypothetical protein